MESCSNFFPNFPASSRGVRTLWIVMRNGSWCPERKRLTSELLLILCFILYRPGMMCLSYCFRLASQIKFSLEMKHLLTVIESITIDKLAPVGIYR